MKLNKATKQALLSWIAEGLDSREINENASKFDPPFSVSRQQVDYYRKTRHAKIDKLISEYENKGLNEGLARVAVRVERLQRLAEMLEKDIFEKQMIWLEDKKGIGTGAIAEIYEFTRLNKAEIDTLLKVYDDLAKETGGRIMKIAPTDPTGEKEYGSDVRDIIRSKLFSDLATGSEES